VQLATAIVSKSDSYLELPWKAFALGAALAGLALVVIDARDPQWATTYSALACSAAILLTGAAAALIAILVPSVARAFLRDSRRIVEVRQHAESLFLRHAVFGTRSHRAVLILVSLFERRIEILADTGLDGVVTAAEWQTIVDAMTPHMRERRPFHALHSALTAVDAVLAAKGLRVQPGERNELPDRTIEERSE